MEKHKLVPEQWIDKYGDQLLRYALLRIPERDIARDLVQDTFVTALKSIESFRGELSEKNWLFLILRSRMMDYYKKKKEYLAPDNTSNSDKDDLDFFDEKGSWLKDKLPQEWTTDRTLQTNEFMQVFEQCMNLLKINQKEAFAMKYVEGLDSEKICKELNVTSSNYWVLIHRAKLQLRDCLEKKWINQ